MFELRAGDIVNPQTGLTAYELMLRPCQTKDELHQWLLVFLGIDLPDAIVDTESTSSPMEMAWMIYSNCVHYNRLKPEERNTKMLFYASRMSFKTLACAAVEFAIAIHDHRGCTHTAAILDQARKAFNDYYQSFLRKPVFHPILMGLRKNSSDQCVFENGTSIKIIPTTRQAAQSQHESLLVKDELEVVQDIRAYRDLSGIPINMPDGRPPVEVSISVRKSNHGLVQQEIEAAGKNGSFVGHWNLIDVTERCPDERSGTKPIRLHVLKDTLSFVDDESFAKIDPTNRLKYETMPALEGCAKCKIFAGCQTNLKRQTSQSTWLKKIDFVIDKLKNTSEEVVISQLLCRKPPSEGLVYTRFDEKNIKSYREMYEVFAGEPWPQLTMSLDDFIGVMKRYGVHCVAGIDWGFTNPSVCLVMYIDSRDNVYVVYAMSRTGVDDADFVRMIAEDIQPRFNVQLYFPDIENPSAIKMMIGRDLPVSKKVDKTKGSVYNGIQIVKSFITVPGTNKAKLFVTRENGADGLITEMGKYHHKTDAAGRVLDDEYEDAYNHHEDALRYPLNTIYGKFQVHLAVSGSEDAKLDEKGNPKPPEVPSKDDAGNFFRAPTAAELAETLGIPGFVDNREEVAKRNQPKDPKDEGKGGGGSSGTFSWSF